MLCSPSGLRREGRARSALAAHDLQPSQLQPAASAIARATAAVLQRGVPLGLLPQPAQAACGHHEDRLVSSLAEAYPLQQKRCRDLLAEYKAIGPEGAFGAAVLEDLLTRAEAAMASGDLVAMLGCYDQMERAE